jgi:hypothetical protein
MKYISTFWVASSCKEGVKEGDVFESSIAPRYMFDWKRIQEPKEVVCPHNRTTSTDPGKGNIKFLYLLLLCSQSAVSLDIANCARPSDFSVSRNIFQPESAAPKIDRLEPSTMQVVTDTSMQYQSFQLLSNVIIPEGHSCTRLSFPHGGYNMNVGAKMPTRFHVDDGGKEQLFSRIIVPFSLLFYLLCFVMAQVHCTGRYASILLTICG